MSKVSSFEHPKQVMKIVTWNHDSQKEWIVANSNWKDALCESLGQYIGILVKKDIPDAHLLQDIVEQASTSSFSRVLMAPSVSSRIMWKQPKDETVKYLLNCFAVEAYREGDHSIKIPEYGELWSALGDYYISRLPSSLMLMDLERGGWSRQHSEQELAIYSAPYVGNFFPLDTCSPEGVRGDGLSENNQEVHECELEFQEVITLQGLLEEALEGIRKVDLNIFHFVLAHTKALSLRTSNSCGFGSSSALTHFGRMTFINPQQTDVFILMESLVHEAVHSLIYSYEVRDWWMRPERQNKVHIRSPWSGNMLPLHSYVHACFVWYALWQFWSLALTRSVFPVNMVEERLIKCGAGFFSTSISKPLQEWAEILSPGIIEICNEMQSKIVS
ncbi:hypothetical protein [Bacillus cereus group sp. BfR-BA-01383]|uniref:hypothetical protein n=1 Tax=Bacillus cereus group sp. BfR-BA-01383 TaxID=2920327 RepID=UPI001F5A389D|nr:hypothetical protein [Bacillus cereus group sp. BfR-BA-01383]